MKASIAPIAASDTTERPGWLGVFLELIKARLTSLVLLTTLVGFYVGTKGALSYARMFHALLGTALVAGGAAALNQFLEREHDARMRRTRTRPLPSGRIQPETALVFGGVCAAAGLIYLALTVNLLTSVVGAVTLTLYLFIYTPLKRVTSLNTIIGAIPGALPPLMGWTAARGEVSAEAWSLFGILFFWQLPHFLAIAWIYRDEYAKAGFVMLPGIDPGGVRTGRQTVGHALGLLVVSLFPFLFQVAGMIYFSGALILSSVFLWFALQFSRHLTNRQARTLFLVSILYLPVLLGLMVFDKLR